MGMTFRLFLSAEQFTAGIRVMVGRCLFLSANQLQALFIAFFRLDMRLSPVSGKPARRLHRSSSRHGHGLRSPHTRIWAVPLRRYLLRVSHREGYRSHSIPQCVHVLPHCMRTPFSHGSKPARSSSARRWFPSSPPLQGRGKLPAIACIFSAHPISIIAYAFCHFLCLNPHPIKSLCTFLCFFHSPIYSDSKRISGIALHTSTFTSQTGIYHHIDHVHCPPFHRAGRFPWTPAPSAVLFGSPVLRFFLFYYKAQEKSSDNMYTCTFAFPMLLMAFSKHFLNFGFGIASVSIACYTIE